MRIIKNPDVAKLYERLAGCAIGEVMSYGHLSEMLGYGIRDKPYILQQARRRLQDDLRYVFATIANVGIQRMTDAEIVNTGSRSVVQIRERAHRAAKTLACVQDFDAMTNEQKLAHNTSLSILGALSIALEPERIKRVESATGKALQALAVQETLAALR